MGKFFSFITTLAAGLTISTNFLLMDSAQASSFYDFNIQWNDNTTTTGWLEVDDTPEFQRSLSGYYGLEEKVWTFSSLLNASFTHESTVYEKSAITTMKLEHAIYPAEGHFERIRGRVYNELTLNFADRAFTIRDRRADKGLEDFDFVAEAFRDSGSKSGGIGPGRALNIRLSERSVAAVPEPTTIAGLVLAGSGFLAARLKQKRKLIA